jgi:hypothetical protein
VIALIAATIIVMVMFVAAMCWASDQAYGRYKQRERMNAWLDEFDERKSR